MVFFNVIPTPGLGKKKDFIKQEELFYGQARVSINANPLNGNLFLKDFTRTLVEQGFTFEIGYQYNSQSKNPWKLTQGKVIGPIEGPANKINSFVVVEESDGHESTFTYDPERGSYVNWSAADGFSVLNYNKQDGKWRGWSPGTNLTESYNNQNQLQEVSDASGNHAWYEYDTMGRLITIGGNSGLKIVIEYNDQRTTMYSVDGSKKVVMMKYLFNKDLLEKTVITVNDEEEYYINYSYSEDSGLLECITQTDKTEVRFQYEKQCLSSIINGMDIEFLLSYEENITQLIDPLGNQETFVQNDSGLLEKHYRNEHYEDYYYDKLNRITSIQYQDESREHFAYDALGLCSKLIRRSKDITLFNRNEKTGLVSCETHIVTRLDSVKYRNTFYFYNNKEELIFKLMPNGALHCFSHDTRGNCISERIYLNDFFELSGFTKENPPLQSTLEAWSKQQNQKAVAYTEWSYNNYGQKVSQTKYSHIDQNGKGLKDAFSGYEDFVWSQFGELLIHKKMLNAQDVAIQFMEYDGLSRLVKEVNPLNQITLYHWNEDHQQTTFLSTGLVTTKRWNKGGAVSELHEESQEYTKNSSLVYDDAGRLCIIETDQGAKEYTLRE